jgi:hypothetical protein
MRQLAEHFPGRGIHNRLRFPAFGFDESAVDVESEFFVHGGFLSGREFRQRRWVPIGCASTRTPLGLSL